MSFEACYILSITSEFSMPYSRLQQSGYQLGPTPSLAVTSLQQGFRSKRSHLEVKKRFSAANLLAIKKPSLEHKVPSVWVSHYSPVPPISLICAKSPWRDTSISCFSHYNFRNATIIHWLLKHCEHVWDHIVVSDSSDPLSAAAHKCSRAASENFFGVVAERSLKSKFHRVLAHLWHLVPWQLMLDKLLWTVLVVFVFVLTSRKNATILFLLIHLVPSSNIAHALWRGLFVLLTFLVSLCADIYETRVSWIILLKAVILPLARCIRLTYRRENWHDRDDNRLVSRLAAFPVCVKLHLSG